MKKLKIFLITLIGVMILGIFLYSQNKWISLEQITVQSTRLPHNFDGFKIMHLSDLHGQYFGKNQSDLLKKINTFKPDLIAITGDLFDSSYDDEASFSLIEQLSDYPVYFVTGNHEAWKNDFEALENLLTQVGVHVLHNKQETLEINGQSIELVGIDDPDFGSSVDNNLRVALQESESNKFKILLSHRPEAFETYVESNVDLVLSGHAHGGRRRHVLQPDEIEQARQVVTDEAECQQQHPVTAGDRRSPGARPDHHAIAMKNGVEYNIRSVSAPPDRRATPHTRA